MILPVTLRRCLVGAFIAGAPLQVRPAAAHPLSVSYTTWIVSETGVHATIRLPLDDVDLLLRLDTDLDGTVSPEELGRARPSLANYQRDRVMLTAGGRRIDPLLVSVGTWRDRESFPYLETVATYPLPAGGVEWSLQVLLLTDLYSDHRVLAEIVRGDTTEEFLFQHGNVYNARRPPGTWQTAGGFIAFGVEHIFTGYDHILFLFGLLLVGRSVRDVVAVVTSFTVAHSITLSIAALGLFEPTPWTIEAAIALSVAYVGLENLFIKDTRHRWVLTFAFGLVHGFGFANLLREIHLEPKTLALSLFSFNTGVEIGQVAIVALIWPALRLLTHRPYHRLAVRITSMSIAAIGLVWFYQRVM
jgi:hydrogenase/urease accessory protein HupE